jgi:protein-L-isoaspartate(D-aspartate) O-methyltransferase
VKSENQDAQEGDAQEALAGFILNLRARGIRNTTLLNAVERAPRTDFLPAEYADHAYHSMVLPLPCGQEAGCPFAIVETISALQIEPQHHVLEIGTGSGWQTALIGSLATAVASVERWQTLADSAEARLTAAGISNVVVAHGDGTAGLPSAGPFDRIIINAAIDELSPLLQAQLAEGGLVIAPLQGEDGQFLTRFEMRGDRLYAASLGPTSYAPLCEGSSLFL